MNKNDKFNCIITDLNDDGQGVAKINNEVVFIPYCLPEESVSGVIINAKQKFAIGKAQEITNKSNFRATPPCPYFEKCGGCDLQHLIYEKQLEFKQNKVNHLLKKIANIDFSVLPTYSANQLRYRNKIALPINENGEIGLYRKNTHNILKVDDCLISKEWIKDLICQTEKYIKLSKDSGYNELTKQGNLRHIVARELNGNFLFTIVTTQNQLKDKDLLIKLLKEKFDFFGLNININKSINNAILSNEWKHLYGLTELTATDNGITYPVNNASFLQINDDVKNVVYKKICDQIEDNEIVINAYSGAGLLSAQICKKAKECYGVEIVKEATENANTLAKNNNLTNLINICDDCAKQIPILLKKHNASTIILDPPRKGVDEKVLKSIIDAKLKKIIYLSCNPSTLARDIKILTENGYKLTYAEPFDMFPQTAHVETLTTLTLN